MVSPKKQKQNRHQTDTNESPGSPGQGSVGSIDERSGVSKMEDSAHDQSNSSAEAAKQERLMRLQMDDLGTIRRERLSTEDDPKNIHHVQHQVLEATRGSNIPGTEAYRKASQNRTVLAAWANVGKIVASQETSHEQLADLGGGQTHRSSLNARLAEARSFHNESTRTDSAKRARGKSRAGAQVAQSHRHFNPIATRVSTMPVVSHSGPQYPPAKVITSGKGQNTKTYDSLSQSSSQEGGSLGARGRSHTSRRTQVGAVRDRPDTSSHRQIGNWADSLSRPQVFLDNLRQHRHLASPPPGTRTPSEPVQWTSQPNRSASRSPRVIWTPRRSASRLSQSVPLGTRSPPVLTQPDPHQPALQPAPQPISQSSSESVHPSALSGVAGNLVSSSTISDVSALGISRQSTPLAQRRKLVPTSRRPLQNDVTQSMSDLPPRDNLMLDLEEEVQMPTLGQERVLNSVYSELTGLDFGEPALLDWSTSVTPARPNQTPAEIGAAIRAEALDFNRSRGLGGSHLPDNSPPATLTFERNLSGSDTRVIPVANDAFFLSTSGVPTTEDASLQASPFSVVTHTGQNNKIAVRDTHSSLTFQSLDQTLFNSYRSPDGTPSSRESKKSKTHNIPSPSCLSPKKVKRADFNSGFERLRVSESPTCAPAAFPTLAAVPTPADDPKVVGTLRHSRWAEPRLKHHEIENSKSKVIGVCASLEPQYSARHHSVWEHPQTWDPKAKIPRTASRSAGPCPQLEAPHAQRIPTTTLSNDSALPRARPQVLDSNQEPVSVESQQDSDFNRMSLPSLPKDRNTSAGGIVANTRSSWFTPTGTSNQASPRPEVQALEPLNTSSQTAAQFQQQANTTMRLNNPNLPYALPRVIGPAPGPVSVWSQRQDDLNRIALLENRKASTVNFAPTASSTQSTAPRVEGQTVLGAKPKPRGLEPYNPSSRRRDH